MKRLQLDEQSLRAIETLPEAGMDYYIASGDCYISAIEIPLIIRSNGTFIPFKGGSEVYDLGDLIEGTNFPDKDNSLTVKVTSLRSDVSLANCVNIPAGYVPTQGAHKLLGSITLGSPTNFFRYTSTPNDPKYTAGHTYGTIKKDTYLTSINDKQFANTGFGAVGRYAIPLPMPASHQHDYTLPAGTRLLVGTVAPSFGQAGGGVEVKTIDDVQGVSKNICINIDDY